VTRDSYLRLLDLLRSSQRETAIACALASDLKSELRTAQDDLRVARELLAAHGIEAPS